MEFSDLYGSTFEAMVYRDKEHWRDATASGGNNGSVIESPALPGEASQVHSAHSYRLLKFLDTPTFTHSKEMPSEITWKRMISITILKKRN